MSAINKILVVDDDPNALSATVGLLKAADYEVFEANTGQECIAAAQANHPDLVLLDIMLPDINGLEVCAQIKAMPSLAHLFVVLISASQTSSDQQSIGLESGADGYIALPISNRELLARVQALLRIKRAEDALRESEARYTRALQAVNDGIWDWHIPSGQAFFSALYYTMLGYEDGEFPATYDAWRLLVHPEDIDRVERELQESIETGSGFNIDLRMRKKTGQWLWVCARGRMIEVDIRGKALRMVGVLSEIAERKRAEEVVQRNEARFRCLASLLEYRGGSIKDFLDFALDEAIKLTQSKFGYIYFYHEDRQLFILNSWSKGVMKECAIVDPQTCYELDKTGIWGEAVRQRQPIMLNDFQAAHPLRKGYPEGHAKLHKYLTVPVFSGNQIVAVVAVANKERDYEEADIQQLRLLMSAVWKVVEQRKAEEALQESEKRFLAFMHHLPAAAFIKDPDGRTLFANQYLADVFGFKNRECKTTTELVGGALGQQMTESDRKTFAQGTLKIEETISDFQGVVRTFETIKFPIFIQGKPALLGGISRDITERKQAVEKLRDSETKYRRLVDNCPDILYIFSEQKGGVFYSRQVENLLGYSIDYLYSHPLVWSQSIHPDDLANVRQVFNEAAPCKPFVLEYRLRDAQGNWRWIYDRSIARYQQNGDTLIEGLATDITERKRMEAENARLEAQLRQIQKQEAIGQLAGGVAHDFNNILAAMMMNIGFMEQNPKLDETTQESLKELLAEAERAASLTRQLLMFSRKSVMEKKALDMNEVVANLLKMLGRLIGEHVSIRFERANGLPLVEADQGMIEQVLMNLAVNARDAMPDGGKLVISLKIVPVGAEGIKGKVDVLPGTFVCLSVQDTGCGMDQATLNKIFEPFFTTKEVGKGTGLGLATVYGIAALHKGWVEVESEVGQGTTFRVYLPQRIQGILEPDQTMKKELLRGRETILLVEDNEAVRRMSVRGLKSLGYQVLEADHGLAGLKLWQDHRGEIDLLLTDMVMPEGLTGLALAEKLKAEKPNLKVIISSGYNDDMSGQTTAQLKGTLYLQKPYEIGLLSKKIRECLDGA